MQENTPNDNNGEENNGANPPQITPNEEINMLRLGLEQLTDLIKTWIKAKYSHDNTGLLIFSILVTFILATIITLSCLGVLKENSVVAILGSLIGYALGKFNNSNGGNKQ